MGMVNEKTAKNKGPIVVHALDKNDLINSNVHMLPREPDVVDVGASSSDMMEVDNPLDPRAIQKGGFSVHSNPLSVGQNNVDMVDTDTPLMRV